jgi:mRNA interferase RelE/StbE
MYIIDYHNDVEKDFKDLGNRVTILALKKIEKLLENPIMGDKLGNKANLNLTGLRKVYIDNKRVRIVYKVIENKIKVFVVAVGKRDDMEVYKKASSRINNA